MFSFYKKDTNKSRNRIHISKDNITCCRKENTYISLNNPGKKDKLCKNCVKKWNIKFIKLYNNHIILYDNNIYNTLESFILNTPTSTITTEGYITINTYTVNLITINKNKYYLINDIDLYELEMDIYNLEKNKKKGRLLGPKMAIINRDMEIIQKLKYNLWEIH